MEAQYSHISTLLEMSSDFQAQTRTLKIQLGVMTGHLDADMFKNLVLNQLDLNQSRMNLTANVVQVSKIVNQQRPIRTFEYNFRTVLNVGMTHTV